MVKIYKKKRLLIIKRVIGPTLLLAHTNNSIIHMDTIILMVTFMDLMLPLRNSVLIVLKLGNNFTALSS